MVKDSALEVTGQKITLKDFLAENANVFASVHNDREIWQIEDDGFLYLALPIEYEKAFGAEEEIKGWERHFPLDSRVFNLKTVADGEKYAVFKDAQNRKILLASQALANSIIPAYLHEQFLSRRFQTAVENTQPHRQASIPHRITVQPDGTIVVEVFSSNSEAFPAVP